MDILLAIAWCGFYFICGLFWGYIWTGKRRFIVCELFDVANAQSVAAGIRCDVRNNDVLTPYITPVQFTNPTNNAAPIKYQTKISPTNISHDDLSFNFANPQTPSQFAWNFRWETLRWNILGARLFLREDTQCRPATSCVCNIILSHNFIAKMAANTIQKFARIFWWETVKMKCFWSEAYW